MQTESAPPLPPFVLGELFHELSVWSCPLCWLSSVGKEREPGFVELSRCCKTPPPSRGAPGPCQPELVPATRPFTGGQVGFSTAQRAPNSLTRLRHLCLQAGRESPSSHGPVRLERRASAAPQGSGWSFLKLLAPGLPADISCPEKVPPLRGRKPPQQLPGDFSPGLSGELGSSLARAGPVCSAATGGQPVGRGLPGGLLHLARGSQISRGRRWPDAGFQCLLTGRPNRGLLGSLQGVSGFGRQEASRAPPCGNKQKGVCDRSVTGRAQGEPRTAAPFDVERRQQHASSFAEKRGCCPEEEPGRVASNPQEKKKDLSHTGCSEQAF